jgi:large subunit ribosomal protein L22
MLYMTTQKNIGDSPRKLRLVADMVRSMTPEQAVEILEFTNKAAAPSLAKAIKTAMANAKGTEAPLRFEIIEINEGMKMKRYRMGTAGRGRGRRYKRRLSHIKVVLTDEVKELVK